MNNLEHKEQATLIEWWAIYCREYHIDEALLFAIPNGGARSAITGAMLKAEGVRKGIPDLFLAIPKEPFHGLFIEMKKPKGGIVSDEQSIAMDMLKCQRYKCEVCRGWAQAREAICAYLGNYL